MTYFVTYRRNAAKKSSGVPMAFRVGTLMAPKTLKLGGLHMHQDRPVRVDLEYLKAHQERLFPLLKNNAVLIKDEAGEVIDLAKYTALVVAAPVPPAETQTPAPVVDAEVANEEPVAEPPGAVDEPVELPVESPPPPDEPAPTSVEPQPVEQAVEEIKPEFELKQINVDLLSEQEAAPEPPTEKTESQVAETVEEPQTAADAPHVYTKTELDAMPFNQLRQVVKDLGVKADGSRKVLTERILELQTQG